MACARLGVLVAIACGMSLGTFAEWTCDIDVPDGAVGTSRTAMVTYANTGTAAIAAPHVRVEAGDGAYVRFSEADAWAKSVEFLATSEKSPASKLRAGETVQQPIFVYADAEDAQLTLSYTQASAEAFPWATLGPQLKPSNVSNEAWPFALATLRANLGETWNAYLDRLRADADYLAGLGQRVRRTDKLLQMELNIALGNDAALPALAQSEDAARSARGMGLSFTRTYSSALSARFTKGILGYGWTDNLSAHAERSDDCTLVIRMPSGGSYSFTNVTGSWQPEDARDATTLEETPSAYVLTYENGTVHTFAKSNMRTSSIADNSGNTLTFTWSGAQLQRVEHTDGQSLAFTYSGGLLRSVTDDRGRTTTYAYSGDLLTGVTTFNGFTTSYEYRAADGTPAARALSRIVYHDGTSREFEYDAAGRVSAVVENGGKRRTTIARTGVGVTTLTAPNGGKTTVSSGPSGEALLTTDALGNAVKRIYSKDGLLESVVAPSGKKNAIGYDASGRATTSASPAGAQTTFAYAESFGNLAQVTDGNGNAVEYGYDENGRGTSVAFSDGTSSRVEYNPRGDVWKTYNRRGQAIVYEYDSMGRLKKKTWPNGRIFTYVYDDDGNCVAASDSETGTVNMQYDQSGRTVRISYPGGRGFDFAYDDSGRLASRTAFDGTCELFSYDEESRLVRVCDAEGAPFLENAYDAKTGRLAKQTYGNGASATYAYDLLGRVTSITHKDKGGRVREALSYRYDMDGKCVASRSLEGEETYGYDADGQLVSVVYPDGKKETFAYDAVGNRIQTGGSQSSATYTVNNLNQYTEVVNAQAARSTIAYDADGNMTSVTDADGTTTFTYDVLNRLVAATNVTTGLRWSCRYDAFGNRVSVTDNGVTTERVFLPGSLPSVAAEYVNGELTERHVVVGSVRIADLTTNHSAPTTKYYHADLIGSTRIVTDENGTMAGRAAYTAFGETRKATGDIPDAGYVGTLGVETDPTGLLFMRNRYYAPGLGRFIQMDPIGLNGGDVNLYRYCGNCPCTMVDHIGLYHFRTKQGYQMASRIDATMSSIDVSSLSASEMEDVAMINATPYIVDFLAFSKDHFMREILPPLKTGADIGLKFWPAVLGGWAGGIFSLGYSIVSDIASGERLEGDILSVAIKSAEEKTGKSSLFGKVFLWASTIRALIDGIEKYLPESHSHEVVIEVPDGDSGSGGSGTIMNQDDWLRIAADTSEDRNGERATYVLGADITIDFDRKRYAVLNSYGHVVEIKDTPIGYNYKDSSYLLNFSGKVKGNGHKIYITGTHMIIDGYNGGSFLFSKAVGATFEDVTFVGCGIFQAENCTFRNCLTVDYPLVGTATSCTFESCSGTVSMTAMPDKFKMGALVCEAEECTFSGCKIDGEVKGEDCTGGLVGDANWCSFTDCLAKATVSGEDNVGGLVGWAENCDFMNSAARGAVSGKSQAGGLVGYSENCNYATCQAKGTVTGGDSVGGFVGDLRGGNMSKCSATGKVVCDKSRADTPDEIGGFAGQIIENTAVEDCAASGAVSAAAANSVGGFAGSIKDAMVQRCYASGAVTGGGVVGGFAGELMECKVYNCYATGAVAAKGFTSGSGVTKSVLAYAGGFAGMADSKGGADCRYCYASGKVTTIKANLAKMVLAYSGGLTPLPLTAAQAKMMPASILKTMMSDCVACYWNTSTTGQKYSGMGSGKSTTAMKKKGTFSGWNSGIWNFSAGYPYLSALGKTGAIPLVGEADPAPPSTKPKLTVAAVGDKSGCKVTGGGSYKKGTKVTLKATAAKTALFDGWYADEECTQKISSKATYTFTTGSEARGIYAKFTAKKTKLAETTFNCFEPYTLVAGKKCSIKLGVTSPLSTKLTVSGLPKGLSFKNGVVSGTPVKPGTSKVKLTAKNSAGTKTKTVVFSVVNPGFDMTVAGFFAGTGGEATAVAAGETVEIPVGVSQTIKVSSIPGLEGVSKSAATVKVSGLPTGMKYSGGKITGVPTKKGEKKTVKIAFSNKWGWSSSFSFKMNVVALPAWVAGTFIGGNADCSASVTISSVGKTSGKVMFAGDTWTLAASSLSADAATGGYRIKATRTNAKKKKATMYLLLVQLADGRGHIEAEDGTFWAESSIWKSSDEWKAAAAALVGMTCQLEDATLGTLTVTMKAGGTAMVSDGYRSASTMLIPLDVSVAPAVDPGTGAVSPFEAELHVLLPARTKAPKKVAAFRRIHIVWNGVEWVLAEGD